VEYQLKEYPLQQGALEIQYIEEYFTEFPRKKSATEILDRLEGRTCLILMAEAQLPEDPTMVVPVSFKVLHELRENESDPRMFDLVERIRDDESDEHGRGDLGGHPQQQHGVEVARWILGDAS